jgi:hypothetical protein
MRNGDNCIFWGLFVKAAALSYKLGAWLAAVMCLSLILCADEGFDLAKPATPIIPKIQDALDDERTKAPTPLEPEPQDESLPSPEPGDAGESTTATATEAPPAPPTAEVEPRPVVYAYTQRTGCNPCRNFRAWHAVNSAAFPMEFKVIEFEQGRAPDNVMRAGAIPLFLVKDAKGGWQPITGWGGPEAFVVQYRKFYPRFGVRPAHLPPVQVKAFTVGMQPVGAPLVDQLSKFAGAKGRIVVTPESPVQATLDDGTVIEYSSLAASWDAATQAGRLTVVIEKPFPVVYLKKFGVWVHTSIDSARFDLDAVPQTATIGTGLGHYTIRLEQVK